MDTAVYRAARVRVGADADRRIEMNDPLESVFVRSGIERWKLDWSKWRSIMSTRKQRGWARKRMRNVRREAALERIIARMQRAAQTFSEVHTTDENGVSMCDVTDLFYFDCAFDLNGARAAHQHKGS